MFSVTARRAHHQANHGMWWNREVRQASRRRRIIARLARLVLVFGLAGALLGMGTLTYFVQRATIPQPSELASAESTIFYFDDGKTELGRIGDANRQSVPLSDIPQFTQTAVLAAEDRTFYEHGGFSVRGIARAVWNNVRSSSTQGGSTITQQYAKNAYVGDARRIQRKVKELVLSIKLETVTSKDKILENYLNTIYFGRGAYGIETASQQYFGKSVQDLDIPESAVLAAIIQAPNALSPEKNLDRLMKRYDYVLDGMVEMGKLTPEERAAAEFPTIKEFSPPNTFGGPNGHLLEQARQAVLALGISEEQLSRSGYTVVTTFNKRAQDAAVAAVRSQGPKTGTKGLRIGLAAVRPGTGEVVAIYGGADYLKDQFNNATQAIGQAGSTFKPFTLAAALENDVSLATTFSGKNKTTVQDYVVVNYGNRSYGKSITLLKATMNSVNSAYVQVADRVGLENVENAAIRAGIPADAVGMMPNLAFTLGTASPHVVDIAGAYATFAAGGVQATPTYIKLIKTTAGDTLYSLKPKPVRAFDSEVADTVTYALQQTVKGGTAFAAQKLGRPCAAKTGTTNDNKSALFAGYVPQLAAAVMLTKDGKDGQPITLSGTGGLATVTGGSFPGRIWTEFMKGALKGLSVEKFNGLPAGQPDGVTPTDAPSPSPSPTATGAAATVPDVSSDQFYAQEGGSFAAAQALALQYGFVLDWTSTVAGINPAKAYVVLNSQDIPAFTTAREGDIITVQITDKPAV